MSAVNGALAEKQRRATYHGSVALEKSERAPKILLWETGRSPMGAAAAALLESL